MLMRNSDSRKQAKRCMMELSAQERPRAYVEHFFHAPKGLMTLIAKASKRIPIQTQKRRMVQRRRSVIVREHASPAT